MYDLRPYQKEAVDSIFTEWDEKHRKKTLLVLPTGCGKTICFAAVADRIIKRGGRVLVLAHRDELLAQARDKLTSVCGITPAMEKGKETAIGSSSPIVISSVQSLSREKRLLFYPRDYFAAIIIDEAHHAPTNDYKKILEHFSSAKVLGVTATPERGDHKKLGFDSIAYEYSLPQAVKDGWLSPILAQTIPLKLDITSVHIEGGDYAKDELKSVLTPYLHEIAQKMLTYCKGRKTVAFLPLVSMCDEFCSVLNKVGISAHTISGKSSDRSEILSDFSSGKYSVLCNAMLLTEGWDCPAVDCIIVLRPTRSESLYRQMVGRGMRLSKDKENLLLLDFLWMTKQYDLCKPSMLAGIAPEIAADMDRKCATDGAAHDLFELEHDVRAEREDSLIRSFIAHSHYKEQLLDPMQYAFAIADSRLVSILSAPASKRPWEEEEILEIQKRRLVESGIDPRTVKTRGTASALIREISRKDTGHVTPEQVAILKKHGIVDVKDMTYEDAEKKILELEPERARIEATAPKERTATPRQIRYLKHRGYRHVETWTVRQASNLISRLKANHDQPLPGIVPALYRPS